MMNLRTRALLAALIFSASVPALASAHPTAAQEKREPAAAPRMKGAEKGTVIDRAGTVESRTKPNAPPAAPAKPDIAPLRTVAKQMMTMERVHRERQARMDRLLEVFNASQAFDKAKEVEALRQKENTRYSAAMDGYKKAIGADAYTKILAAMSAINRNNGVGQPPPPSQPPPPAPDEGRVRKKG